MSSFRNFAITFCISVLLFGVVAYFLVSSTMGVFGDGKKNDTEATDSKQVVVDPNKESDSTSSSFTMLFAGSYDKPDPDDASKTTLSNIFIMVRYSEEKKTILYTPFPANTKIITGGVLYTMSGLCSTSDVSAVCESVAGLTGFYIDTRDNFYIADAAGYNFETFGLPSSSFSTADLEKLIMTPPFTNQATLDKLKIISDSDFAREMIYYPGQSGVLINDELCFEPDKNSGMSLYSQY